MCSECHERQEYRDICGLATCFNNILEKEFGKRLFEQGGNLFLARHYRASRIVHFTLNPGYDSRNPKQEFKTFLSPYNRHWEECNDRRPPKNWVFATSFFNAAFSRWPAFQGNMAFATDAFIIPWRTRDVIELEHHPAWPQIQAYSRQLVLQMLWHHQAKLVFLSGVTTRRYFEEFAGVKFGPPQAIHQPEGDKYRGRLDCRKFYIETLNLAEGKALSEVTFFQIPHFSRSVYSALKSGGQWVGEQLSASHMAT